MQAAGSGGFFGTTTVQVTMPSVSDQVSSAYANHLSLFSSKNVSATVSQYTDDANVTYEGQAAGLQGNYTGTSDIRILIAADISKTTLFFIANETQPSIQVETMGSGDSVVSVVVNSTFNFRGESPVFGNINGTVSARTTFVPGSASGNWLISNETWNYLSYWVQYPVSTWT